MVVLNFLTAETVAASSGRERLNYLFYNTKNIVKQITAIEAMPFIPVMYPHWGRDMDTTVFKTYKLKFNADKWFVFGHHPHVISGISDRFIYSMGNTYIPHPYYYTRYPAVKYGMALMFDSNSRSYDKFLTQVISSDNYKSDFRLTVTGFDGIPAEVTLHGNNFGSLKKAFLKVFAFTGSGLDLVRLEALQLMSFVFRLKVRMLKK